MKPVAVSVVADRAIVPGGQGLPRDGRRGFGVDDAVRHGRVVLTGRVPVGAVNNAAQNRDSQCPEAVGGIRQQIHPADIPEYRQHDTVTGRSHQHRVDHRQQGRGIDHHKVELLAGFLDQPPPPTLGE